MIGFIGVSESAPYFTSFMTALFIINFIIACTIIFLERKNPSATLAWIMILFLVPVAGFIFYFFLSQNIARKKIFKLTQNEENLVTSALHKQSKEMAAGVFDYSTPEAVLWKDMIKLHQEYSRAYFTQDNKITVFTDGQDKFGSLLRDIENAEESINIMYFIIKRDEVGWQLIKALTKKAKEGVKVRLMVDSLGSRQITPVVLHEFEKAGGRYAFFFPPKLKWLNIRLNYRNHRKLAIIDEKIGYTGGFNIGKEYLGQKKKFGHWRDTHLRFEGGAVQDLSARFALDWRFASKEKIDVSKIFFTPPIKSGDAAAQIVSSGPDSNKKEIKRGFMKMITSARKTICIQTPYFVPDATILESLKMAAQSGVDVKIMIPCMPDHIFVYWATYSYVGELIRSGGRVFIYDNGFLHAKMMSVDGEVVTVGSTNFDNRSFSLNFEVNAFIYDSREASRLERIFQYDMEHCHELTSELYNKRSSWIKIKESIARLLSDLL